MRMSNFFILLIGLLAIMTLGGSIPLAFGGPIILFVAVAWGTLHASTTMNVSHAIKSRLLVSPTLYPVVITADKAKDVGVDIIDFDSAMFVVNAGAIAAAGLVLPVAQECDTLGGVYTDVAAADLDGAFTNLVANTTQKVGYKGTKRFVAVRMDYLSGTSVAAGALIVAGHPHAQAVA